MSLMVLGAFVGVVGVCDLFRADRDVVRSWRLFLMAAVGAGLIAGFLRWTADSRSDAVLVGLGLYVALLMWVFGSAAALRVARQGPPRRRAGAALRWVAFGGLGLGVLCQPSNLVAGGLAWPWGSAASSLARSCWTWSSSSSSLRSRR